MDELMNNTTYNYNALAVKYRQFSNPCCYVSTDGKNLSADLGLYVDSMKINQTIGDKSGQCSFTIQNAYDHRAGKFSDSITKYFQLGQTIEAGIGYGTPVGMFKGYVADVNFNFGNSNLPSVTVTCNDIRTLMKQGRLNAKPPISPFAVMMPLLMAYYTSLFKMKIIYFDFWNVLEDFKQNTNDFNYIYNYAKTRGYEFFVLGDYSYFRKRWMFTSPVLTLRWGENIISFSRNFTYTSANLKGAFDNILSLLPFLQDNMTAKAYPSKMAALQVPQRQMDTSEAKNNLDLVNIMATHVLSNGDDMVGGQVSCIGLPEIVPGRYIRLEKLDADILDKNYYVTDVTHNLSSGGYITSFQVSAGR